MGTPSGFELFIILFVVVVLFAIPVYIAKQKNFSIPLNIIGTLLLGPFWILIMLIRKKKEVIK